MTLDSSSLLYGLPDSLRNELLKEYRELIASFYEGRWRPTELQAGRFCEVVYSIIAGRASGKYPSHASKPSNFLKACKDIEQSTNLERGLRILAARVLPALYEIRNSRDVGHVGGDVDPNFMDSSYVVAAASWLMAELIRVLHSIDPVDAKRAVDQLTQLKTPAVWSDADIRRVLNPKAKLNDQILLLVASSESCTIDQLLRWTEASNKSNLKRAVVQLHKARMIEAAQPEKSIRILPPGANIVRKLLTGQ